MGIENFSEDSPYTDDGGNNPNNPAGPNLVEYTPADIESTKINESKMKGFFLGIMVGEGSFVITTKPEKMGARAKYSIKMHKENAELLQHFYKATDLGNVTYTDRWVDYRVSRVEECVELAQWIENSASGTIFKRTAKYDSFKQWCQCLSFITDGKHASKQGLIELAELREGINRDSRGRSAEEIKEIIEK